MLLIFISAYAKTAAIVTSESVLGAVIAAGVFLILVALLGLYGTRNQHQAALFFYMIILSCVLAIQFIVAIVCLGKVSEDNLKELIARGWLRSDESVKWDAQKAFGCCGLDDISRKSSECRKLPCGDECRPCLPVIVNATSRNLSRVGILGLLFSISEVAGVWLAYRFRNMRDPRIDPDSLFL